MRDLAGNSAQVRRAVIVDRTLGFPGVTPQTCSPNGDGVRDTVAVAFKLTRRAEVTVALVGGADVLRTIKAGELAAGAQSLTWDGKLAGGAFAESGKYDLRVTAHSSVGVTSVAARVTVDRFRPRFTVPATASATLGKTARVAFSVRDPYSPTVKVTVAVSDAAGAAVATVDCGWVKQGTALTCAWKPPARGTYTLDLPRRRSRRQCRGCRGAHDPEGSLKHGPGDRARARRYSSQNAREAGSYARTPRTIATTMATTPTTSATRSTVTSAMASQARISHPPMMPPFSAATGPLHAAPVLVITFLGQETHRAYAPDRGGVAP